MCCEQCAATAVLLHEIWYNFAYLSEHVYLCLWLDVNIKQSLSENTGSGKLIKRPGVKHMPG